MAFASPRKIMEPLRTITYNNIPSAYSTSAVLAWPTASPALINAPLSYPSHQVIFQNLTDKSVYVSIDGINDHYVFSSGQGYVEDVGSNRSYPAEALWFPIGTIFYIRYVSDAPTVGNFYLSTTSSAPVTNN